MKIKRRQFIKLLLKLLLAGGIMMLPFRSWSFSNKPIKQVSGKDENLGNIKYLYNKDLNMIRDNWIGNKTVIGRFFNEFYKFDLKLTNILKWNFSRNPQKKEKEEDTYKVPVIKSEAFFKESKDVITWLGQATMLIRLNNITILTDPVFGNIPFRPRLAEFPCSISSIKNVDYLLISHSHYDHLDTNSIRHFKNKDTEALVPLKMKPFFQSICPEMKTEEAGWYQKYNTKNENGLEIFFMPSQHWSRRSPFDFNKKLWGSFIIKSGSKTVYFAGDTGYAPHLKEIQKLFPDITYAILPIAAYKPPYIMKLSHMTPEEAIKACNDLNAETLIPMHYGTFDLSDEPIGEPIRLLKKTVHAGKLNGNMKILDIGEQLFI